MLQSTSEVGSNKIFEDDNDDDEEEHYVDVKEEDAEEKDSEVKVENRNNSGSWVHLRNLKCRSRRPLGTYDACHRNPAYCGAEHSALWELSVLVGHAHPTVALFAGNLLEGVAIKYSGDPLLDFTLVRFLDRFVFRNPKKKEKKSSVVLSKKRHYLPKGAKAMAPDSKEYANMAESAIPNDERFIFKYLTEKRRARKEAVEDDEDADSVTSEDFDAFMAGYFKEGGRQEDDLDFAGNVGELQDEDLNEGQEDDEEEESENEVDDEEEEEEEPKLEGESDQDDDLNLQNIEDVGSDEDEFDEEAFANSDNDDEEQSARPPKKKMKKTKMKKEGGGLQDLLASAEEFADLVEQAAADDLDLGGAGAVSNVKDRAGKRQLLWERDRGGGGRKKKRPQIKKGPFKGRGKK